MSNERITTHLRKAQALEAAIALAEEKGYTNIRAHDIAARTNISYGLVAKYFGTMGQLRRAIMRAAIARENLTIIAQGLGVKDPHALKASDELKQKAVQKLLLP
jgi:AcrR family transcriptional regulator